MRAAPLVILLSISFSGAFAQFDSLLNKPYPEKLDGIHRLYRQVIDINPDSARAYRVIGGLRQAANRAGDREAALEADLLEALFDYRRLPSASLGKMHNMVQQGKRLGVLHIACRATYVIAFSHWENGHYEQAFRWYAALDSLLQQVTVMDFPTRVGYLKDIGNAYYHFGDYKGAITYFREATEGIVPDFYENEWKHAMNNLGLAYQQLDSLDLSDACFRRIFEHNTKRTEIWEGIASGNLGYNQYLRGNYQAAIPLFQRDIDVAIAHGDYALASGSATPMADILTRQGVLDGAKSYMDSAYAFIHRSGQTDRLRQLFPVMSKWHAAAGHPDQAAKYMDSTVISSKRFHEKFSALQLLRANQEAMASQREAALQQLRAESQRQLNRRNLILAALLLVVVVFVFASYRYRKRNELRLKNRELRLMAAERGLRDARDQLEALAKEAAGKNDRLLELERIHGKDNTLIEELSRQAVLTDEGWRRFSELFDRVHPGFQQAIKTRFPMLTPAEIRCLAMEKLNFGNKEIAALQGISTNAVMVTKHRVRKKLGLTSQLAMEQLLNDF